jgi:hypothetical protein
MTSPFRTVKEWRKQRAAAFKRQREALDRLLTEEWEALKPKRVKGRDVSKEEKS